MAHTKEVERELRNLRLGEYKLLDIIKIIIKADQLQKEGLFEKGPFGSIVSEPYDDDYYAENIIAELKKYFPNGLEDLWVDMTYQRMLKLKKIIEHLRRKDMNNIHRIYFNKMLAGAVDIAIRPDGRGFIWDGFRRSIIALLCGKRFIKTSIEKHEDGTSEADCKAIESFVFKIKNGFAESMPKEELYKSGIVHEEEESMKLYKVIVDMGVDVLGTNPGHPELGAFSEFKDTVISERLETNDYLVQASYKMQKAWTTVDEKGISQKPTNLTGYTLCGLAKFLDVLEKEDEDGNLLCPNISIHTAHPNNKGTCDVERKLVEYAETHNQKDLCANRLAGKSIESVAFNIGRVVMGLNKSQQFELLTALGFDGDEELMNQLTLVSSNKTLAA